MKRLLLLMLLLHCLTLYYLTVSWEEPHRPNRPVSMKSILIWNSVNRMETAYFNVGSASFVREHCPVTQCQIFTERNALPFHLYDAVVMNMLELKLNDRPEVHGFTRSHRQRFIFLNQETPRTAWVDEGRYKNYFNYTMTYRHISDIRLLYGRVRPRGSAPKHPEDVRRLIGGSRGRDRNYATNKTKAVAWMVSHCETDSSRESYVRELQKYIEVDVYGDCGSAQLNCSRSNDWIPGQECYDLLAADYKFYLSFENSACDDYVTEKFFNILAHDLVPVVYGGANYSKLAPPHSYIDAMRFTPRQLARYLNRIANDDRLYNEFFWWKEHYEVETGIEQMVRHAFCDLCQKLHEDTFVKIYKNIDDFWSDLQCQSMNTWEVHIKSILSSKNDSETKILNFNEYKH